MESLATNLSAFLNSLKSLGYKPKGTITGITKMMFQIKVLVKEKIIWIRLQNYTAKILENLSQFLEEVQNRISGNVSSK